MCKAFLVSFSILLFFTLSNTGLTDVGTYDEMKLLERLSSGDSQAFSHIFNRYQPVIYTYVVRLSGSETLAEEIVQDAFLKVWLNKERLKGMQNFGGWLYAVASNLTTDALRQAQARLKNQMRYERAVNRINTRFTPTETLLLEKEYAALLDQAVQLLPERQLVTYKLIKHQGLTREAAAAQMGISVESVKTNLSMAMQKIRAYCLKRMGPLGVLLFLWMNR